MMNNRNNKLLTSLNRSLQDTIIISSDVLPSIKTKSPEAEISHTRIFQSISNWFATCTHNQRKVVLCGITDRCSNTQLEYLSTALEPVFHRDFRNALTGNYPICTSITRSLDIRSRSNGSVDDFGRKTSMDSFVSNYVKDILCNAINRVVKRPDEVVRLKRSLSGQFSNMMYETGDGGLNKDEDLRSVEDSRLPPLKNSHYRPGMLRTGPIKHLPKIIHCNKTNDVQTAKKKQRYEKNNFQKQAQTLWQWINSWENYEKIDMLVQLLKQCNQTLLQFYTQCLLQRLQARNDINCLPDKLLMYIFSFLPADDINTAGKVCRRWRYIAAQDELWILKCKEIGYTKGILDIALLMKDAMDSCLIDWHEAYYELKLIVDNLQMANYQASGKELRVIDVLTPARITPPEEFDSYSSSSTSSSMFSELSADRQRSTVVDLPIQQLETFQKDSIDDIPETDAVEKDNELNNDFISPWESKSKLEVKEEDKKVVKKKKRKPKKPREDNENLALDIRPDHEQAKSVLVTGDIGMEEETMAGEKLTRHLNKVSMMVRAVKRVRRLQGHMNAVCCLKFDRRRIITGSSDHSLRVWDIRSGRSIHKIYGHKGGVRCLAFNDQWILSGSWDTTVIIWDVIKFTQIAILVGHTDVVSALQLIGLKYLVTGSYDSTIRLWCLEDFKFLRTLTTHAKSVTCLAIDGENVISGSTDGLIKITRISDGIVLNTFADQTDPVATLATHHNLILGGTAQGTVYFWDKLTGQVQAAVQLHEKIIHKVAFLPFDDGDARFITTSGDTSIKEWDLFTMTCVRALQGHKGAVRDVQVSEDRIVSCSDDGNVRIWDLMTPQFKPGDKADEDTIETRTINQRQDKKHTI
ncbi:uncharacterized protein [Antedon mediterranea]|uniref:uncharacterized protein n=1 Tax=Antedon mediterranea TaxID=105859 RepID=UPI003AF70C82